jgi:UDP-N-acetylglucosamine--N-acetylmuramyl-(pentapeptide) pyrophosphoryl-undecaprenol N-acetylglucosamine transferase
VILVTVGTNEARFDRLLEAVETIADGEELLVQHGPSPVRPRGARCVDYLDFDDINAEMRRARVVIAHAGVGSVIVALMNDRRPIVVPRLARFAEAVDDHQVPFGRRLHEVGLVRLVEDPAELAAAVAADEGAGSVDLRPNPGLVAELRGYVAVHARGPRSRP